METTNHPVRQTLDVNLNLCIDFWAPRWEAGPVLDEAVDGFLAKVSDKVYRFLEGHPVVVQHYCNNVMCMAFSLFTIV